MGKHVYGVADGVESAVTQAKAAAGDKIVQIMVGRIPSSSASMLVYVMNYK